MGRGALCVACNMVPAVELRDGEHIGQPGGCREVRLCPHVAGRRHKERARGAQRVCKAKCAIMIGEFTVIRDMLWQKKYVKLA